MKRLLLLALLCGCSDVVVQERARNAERARLEQEEVRLVANAPYAGRYVQAHRDTLAGVNCYTYRESIACVVTP